MAVTKRTRFEVLKRDNHTCRYCGASAPEVALQVDHVIPVSLGGTDKPDNLVAACRDCNAGKSSTSTSEAIVAEVDEKALAYAQALRARIKEVTGTAKGLRTIRKRLETYWEESAADHGLRYIPPMDTNWNTTLRHWLSIGLDEDFLEEAIDIAMSREGVANPQRFRYFCGVVYRTLDQAHEQVQGVATTQECGHCSYCRHPELREDSEECAVYYTVEPGDESYECSICGKVGCLYDLGIQDGMQHEWRRNYDAIMHYRDCPEVDRG